MREIKFRAYFKNNNVPLKGMVYEGEQILQLRVMNGKVYWLGIGGLFNPNNPVYSSTEDMVFVMQYTGLKDKNGKEIYEGDIITDEFNGKWIVVWSIKYASFVVAKEKENEPDGSMLLTNLLDKTSEVIGNIYESPELLKELK